MLSGVVKLGFSKMNHQFRDEGNDRTLDASRAPLRLLQERWAGAMFDAASPNSGASDSGTMWSTVSAPGWPHNQQTLDSSSTRVRKRLKLRVERP